MCAQEQEKDVNGIYILWTFYLQHRVTCRTLLPQLEPVLFAAIQHAAVERKQYSGKALPFKALLRRKKTHLPRVAGGTHKKAGRKTEKT